MKTTFFAALAAIGFIMASPAGAQDAQTGCYEYKEHQRILSEEHGERQLLSLVTAHQLFAHAEIWANVKDGTYTVIMVNNEGTVSCPADHGTTIDFGPFEEVQPREKDPA